MFDALLQDLRYALRGIRTSPAFAATVALTIALGVGVDATMFGILDRLLFRAPPGVADPDRVVILETHGRGDFGYNDSFAYPSYTDLSAAQGFSTVGVVTEGPSDGAWYPLGRGTSATRAQGALASATFFEALDVKPALGRFFQRDEDDATHPSNVVVISWAFWKSHFGGERSAIGAMLDIGTQRYRVIGVAPRGFTGIALTGTEVWLPITAQSGLRFDNSPGWTTNYNSQWLYIVARVKPGVSPKVAAEQATVVWRASLRQQIADDPKRAKWISPDSESVSLASVVPGRAGPGMDVVVQAKDVQMAKILGVMALVVLLIACANVGNLLLLRAVKRRREIAVRLALGVSRARLVSQLLVEGLVLSLLGGIGALAAAQAASSSARAWLLGPAAFSGSGIDGRMLAFTALATIATGLLAAAAPALQAGRSDLTDGLKAGAREGVRRSRVRETLIVVQASLAILLLVGAGLFVRSVRNVRELPFGVDIDHVIVASFAHSSVGLSNAEAGRLYREMAERVHTIPGVKAAAVSIALPFAMSWSIKVFVPGRALPALHSQPVQYGVTPEYFAALGIPVRAGRAFEASDRAGAERVAVINRTMAELYWPNMNPVGQCAKLVADTMPCTTIVGVVENTRRQNLVEGLVPQLYRPLDQLPDSSIDGTVSHFGYYLVVGTSGDASHSVQAVRRTMQGVSSSVPYPEVKTMMDLVGRRMRAWQLGARVFTAFGVLALLLAVIGLYAVTAFTVTQRMRDFGVRLALGARSPDLVRLTLGTSLAPVLGGLAVGTVLAFVLGRLVESMLFGVSARDPVTLGGVCAVLLAASTLASLLPAWRATRVDPATVLRSE